jgi:polysaccharide export outer membrane protein
MNKPPAKIAAALALAALAACAGPRRPTSTMAAPPPVRTAFPNIGYATWTEDEPAYRLFPGDEIEVQVPSAGELNKTVTVQPDGRVELPLVGGLMVAGRTIDEAQRAAAFAYSAQLLRPTVNITVKAAPLKVFVGGEVDKPGVYDMPGDINALQAVILAGGFKNGAKRASVVIIRRGADGRAMMRTVDLAGGLKAPQRTDLVPLRRFDVVYVPRTTIAEAGVFVQQYFRDVTPVEFGFNYTVGPAYVAGTNVK